MSKARASSVQAIPMGSKAIHKYFSLKVGAFICSQKLLRRMGLVLAPRSLLRVFRSLLTKS